MKKIYTLFICAISVAVGVSAQTITTIAGSSSTDSFGGDGGVATIALLNQPEYIALDNSGNMFISDGGNHRIRKVAANGTSTTIAGNGTTTYAGDGASATTTGLSAPKGVAVDNSGNIYVADQGCIRKITASGIISTYAGRTDSTGYWGDGGLATTALLDRPMGLAIDAAGNLYCSEPNYSVIRKISATGIITTVAGTGTESHTYTDGVATATGLFRPTDVAVDGAGNVYLSDEYNLEIRKVDTAGMMHTIAGGPGLTFTPGPATASGIGFPNSVTVDAYGNIYISGAEANIYRIDPSGNISEICGDGTPGFSGDGGPAVNAKISTYTTLKTDTANNLVIAEPFNNRVRHITGLPANSNLATAAFSSGKSAVTVYPNPSTGVFTVSIPAYAQLSTIDIMDMLGRTVYSRQAAVNATAIPIDLAGIPSGAYIVKVQNSNTTETRELLIR